MRLWILGAADPEMEAIERLLRESGEAVAYAATANGRVHPGVAYQADRLVGQDGQAVALPVNGAAYAVECGGAVIDGLRASGAVTVMVLDHHRPGDAGYGRPPFEFLAASSLGQVVAELARLSRIPSSWGWTRGDGPPARAGEFVMVRGRWAVSLGSDDGDAAWAVVPEAIVLTAAGDHCPGAAYAGECPGVSPESLMRHRAETRAAFQRRPVEAIIADVESAIAAVRAAPLLELAPSVRVRDLRTPDGRPVPELPEALLRTGEAALARVRDRDGRWKVIVLGAGEGTPAGRGPVEAFLGGWAAAQGLTNLYGDPARGFAGGYEP